MIKRAGVRGGHLLGVTKLDGGLGYRIIEGSINNYAL